jgi:hypothetical protein
MTRLQQATAIRSAALALLEWGEDASPTCRPTSKRRRCTCNFGGCRNAEVNPHYRVRG